MAIKNQIEFEDFLKLDLRAGSIISAKLNEKARIPAYIIEVNFGADIGIKTSSAQLTENYQASDLINKQIIAVINFAPKRIAGVKSEILILGVMCEDEGIVLLHPSKPVTNGGEVG